MADRYGYTDWRDRDWRDRELSRGRREERRLEDADPLEDYGQADFSRDYRYDPATRTGYRVDPVDQARRDYEAERGLTSDSVEARRLRDERARDDYDRYAAERDRGPEERSWAERTGLSALFGGAGRDSRSSNDRVLWVVATEAVHRARGIDDREIEIDVRDGVVILNGTVRSREEKRRVEDLVDQRGVRDVQNNLRIRERRFGF